MGHLDDLAEELGGGGHALQLGRRAGAGEHEDHVRVAHEHLMVLEPLLCQVERRALGQHALEISPLPGPDLGQDGDLVCHDVSFLGIAPATQ